MLDVEEEGQPSWLFAAKEPSAQREPGRSAGAQPCCLIGLSPSTFLGMQPKEESSLRRAREDIHNPRERRSDPRFASAAIIATFSDQKTERK
jgi:hypothetical protein